MADSPIRVHSPWRGVPWEEPGTSTPASLPPMILSAIRSMQKGAGQPSSATPLTKPDTCVRERYAVGRQCTEGTQGGNGAPGSHTESHTITVTAETLARAKTNVFRICSDLIILHVTLQILQTLRRPNQKNVYSD